MIVFITKHAGKLLWLPIAYLILHFFIPIIINLNAELIAKTWIELKTQLLSIVNLKPVFETWCKWQTLTASIIALLASIIGLAIAQHREKEAAKREYKTAKAFLPEAFAELSSFYKKVEDYHLQLFKHFEQDLSTKPPQFDEALPEKYRSTFQKFIRYAHADEQAFFQKILCWIQIDTSRLKNEIRVSNFCHGGIIDTLTVHYYITQNFSWARGEDEGLHTQKPSCHDLENLCFLLYPEREVVVQASSFKDDFRTCFDGQEHYQALRAF